MSGLLIMALYAVFRRAPRTWWLWGSALGFFFLALQMAISPVFIAPLFNTYEPLSDPKISQPILAMASANQIPVQQVFEVDASRQSKRMSANVSGIFGTTRISLNDNLLKQCSLAEVRAVMAHEMGHYVLNHAFKLILYFGLFVAGAFAFSHLFFERAIRRWGPRWGVRGIADPAGLPLLVLLFSVYFFLLTPLANTAMRVTEREADAFGLNTAREANGFAQGGVKARDLSQARPRSARRDGFLRSPERPRPHPDGDGLESGQPAGRRRGRSLGECERSVLVGRTRRAGSGCYHSSFASGAQSPARQSRAYRVVRRLHRVTGSAGCWFVRRERLREQVGQPPAGEVHLLQDHPGRPFPIGKSVLARFLDHFAVAHHFFVIEFRRHVLVAQPSVGLARERHDFVRPGFGVIAPAQPLPGAANFSALLSRGVR